MVIKTSFFFTLLFFFFIISGGIGRFAKGEDKGPWCIAKPSSSNYELQANLDYACHNVASCEKVQKGGSCYEPETLINRASVAMNIYYQEKGKNDWNCDFSNSALVSIKDPSYGNCKYDGA